MAKTGRPPSKKNELARATRDLARAEREIGQLRTAGEPVPPELRLRMLDALSRSLDDPVKKAGIAERITRIEERLANETDVPPIGFTLRELPKEVLKKLTDFKDRGIVPYHPSME